MILSQRLDAIRENHLPAVLTLLDEVAREASGQSSLTAMCRYHFETGGKRLRALLPMLVADSLQRDAAMLVPFASACEMLHNATLVHDDLQDGDRLRRGRETVWSRFGKAQAINLGDAMFHYALLLVQRLEVPPERREKAARRLVLETLSIIDGQEREFALKANRHPTLLDYFAVVEAKTARLFVLAMAGAAELCEAGSEVVDALTEAATQIGVLFQMQDDVVDLYGEKGREQKGSDIGEGKRSLLVVHAMEAAHPEEARWLMTVLDKDRTLTSARDVEDVRSLFDRTGSLHFALQEIEERRGLALAAVQELERPELVTMIAGISEVVLQPVSGLLHDPSIPSVTRPTRRPMSSGAVDSLSLEDHSFCVQLLPQVSRTFALSIGALPDGLRDTVRVAYLLCRIVDSIEDEADVSKADREALFDAFDEMIADDEASPEKFELLSERVGLGGDGAYHELCTGAGAVIRVFRSLAPERREVIRPNVREMSQGMRNSSSQGILRLRDMEALERYCYFVAGTVGKLLTALFEQTVPELSPNVRDEIRSRAVSFGLGLQLVNIVKDVAADFERGDCFLPENLAEQHGVPLDTILDPRYRGPALALLRAVCGQARKHLQRAQEYTLLWPVPGGTPVRLFCAVPLALALATLREVEEGSQTLLPGHTPKVAREMVARVQNEARQAVEDNEALVSMFQKYVTAAPKEDEDDAPPPPRPPNPTGSRLSAPSNGVSATAPALHRPPPSERRYEGLTFVTGASGHLGANLVRRLLDQGRAVRVLLRKGSNNAAVDGLEVERVYGDLRDYGVLLEAVKGCETIYHCAALVSTIEGSAEFRKEIFGCNVVGTHHLLQAAKEAGVARVVVTGSLSAVGYNQNDPSIPSAEDAIFYPFDRHLPYAHTKAQAEHECLKAAAEGLDVVVATSCAILGPHDYKPSRMGGTLLDYAHGRLKAYIPGGFEFVAARDICEGHILAMHRGRPGQKYVFSSEFLTMDEIMDIFEEVSGRPRPRLRLPATVMAGLAEVFRYVPAALLPGMAERFTPGAVRLLRMRRKANIRKAHDELGYEPTSARAAIHEAYADFARRGLVPAPVSTYPIGRTQRWPSSTKSTLSKHETPTPPNQGTS